MPPSSTKSQQAIDRLRRRIVDGQWPPGAQLPVRSDLERELGVSRVTLQGVMDQLASEGFIRTGRRAGTFVCDNPPHRCRYAVLIPASGVHQSRHWEALASEAQRLSHADPHYALTIYRDVWPEWRGEGYDQLIEQVQAHRYAGLIFASAVRPLADTPLVTEPGIPRVSVGSGGGYCNVPAVGFDGRGWLRRALERVREAGRRRVAVIGENRGVLSEALEPEARKQGLHVPPQWQLYLSHRHPMGVRHCAHLLMTLPERERPEALLVADDHLVEHVALGLADAGVPVGEAPGALQVIAHANFPYPPASAMPLTWLGYDMRTVLHRCIAFIDRQRAGERVPAQSTVASLFDHELPTGREESPFAAPADLEMAGAH